MAEKVAVRDDEGVVLADARRDRDEVGVREGVRVPLRVVEEEPVKDEAAVEDEVGRVSEVEEGDAPLESEGVLIALTVADADIWGDEDMGTMQDAVARSAISKARSATAYTRASSMVPKKAGVPPPNPPMCTPVEAVFIERREDPIFTPSTKRESVDPSKTAAAWCHTESQRIAEVLVSSHPPQKYIALLQREIERSARCK